MTDTVTPEQRTYTTTLACPEAITNCVKFIKDRIADPDAAKHINIRIDYSLDYVSPSSRASLIIDALLERAGIDWRIHSVHTLIPQELCRVIIRKVSLVDLTLGASDIEPYEIAIERVLGIYSAQYNQDRIVGPSNIAIFTLPSGKYYWVYTRIFDMWEYNDDMPEAGWVAID